MRVIVLPRVDSGTSAVAFSVFLTYYVMHLIENAFKHLAHGKAALMVIKWTASLSSAPMIKVRIQLGINFH